MKRFTFFILFTLFFCTSQTFGSIKKGNAFPLESNKLSADTITSATVPSEIEYPGCLGINKEPAYATLMAYG